MPAVNEVITELYQWSKPFFLGVRGDGGHSEFSRYTEPKEVLERISGGYHWLHAVTLMGEFWMRDGDDALSHDDRKALSLIGEAFGDTVKRELAARADH